MGHSAQAAPDPHVASGADPRSWIDIAEQQYRALHLQVVAGAQGALVNRQCCWGLGLSKAVGFIWARPWRCLGP